MTAIEFVKNFGIEYAIKILNYDPSILDDVCHLDFGETENLKQIVDAWELVGKVGGLDNAKTFDESCMYCIAHLTTLGNLQKAIKLVEQCQ